MKILAEKKPKKYDSDKMKNDDFALGVSFFIVIFYKLPYFGSAKRSD